MISPSTLSEMRRAFSVAPLSVAAFLFIGCTADLNNNSRVDSKLNKFNNPIVGGVELNNRARWTKSVVMISLQGDDGALYICTGSFISVKHILTAAHCASKDASSMKILFGARPFYDKDYSHLELSHVTFADPGVDLAILHLKEVAPPETLILKLPVISSDNAGPAEVGGLRVSPLPQKLAPPKILALGFGRTTGVGAEDSADLAGSGQLRAVKIKPTPVTSDPATSSAQSSGTKVTIEAPSEEKDLVRFLQNKGRGVCFGDSGGPFIDISRGNIIGVAKGVRGDPTQNEYDPEFNPCAYEGMYTPVDLYLKWIHQVIDSEGATPSVTGNQFG